MKTVLIAEAAVACSNIGRGDIASTAKYKVGDGGKVLSTCSLAGVNPRECEGGQGSIATSVLGSINTRGEDEGR